MVFDAVCAYCASNAVPNPISASGEKDGGAFVNFGSVSDKERCRSGPGSLDRVFPPPPSSPASPPQPLSHRVIVLGPCVAGESSKKCLAKELRSEFGVEPVRIDAKQRRIVLSFDDEVSARHAAHVLNGHHVMKQLCTSFVADAAYSIMGGPAERSRDKLLEGADPSSAIVGDAVIRQNLFDWQRIHDEAMYTHMTLRNMAVERCSSPDLLAMYRWGYRRSSSSPGVWLQGVVPSSDVRVSCEDGSMRLVGKTTSQIESAWVERQRTEDCVVLEWQMGTYVPPIRPAYVKLQHGQPIQYSGDMRGPWNASNNHRGRFVASACTRWNGSSTVFQKSTWKWWLAGTSEGVASVREVFEQDEALTAAENRRSTSRPVVVVRDLGCSTQLRLDACSLSFRKGETEKWVRIADGAWTSVASGEHRWDSATGSPCEAHFVHRSKWGTLSRKWWVDGSGGLEGLESILQEREEKLLVDAAGRTVRLLVDRAVGDACAPQPGAWDCTESIPPCSLFLMDVDPSCASEAEKDARRPLEESVQQLERQQDEYSTTVKQVLTDLRISTCAAKSRDLVLRLDREVARLQARLPAYAYRSLLLQSIRSNQVIVLLGATGSGKSTQSVPFIMDSGIVSSGAICCTQPRRVAAMSLADHVANEWGCKVGEEIGYHVGGGKRATSASTRAVFKTDRTLLEEFSSDRLLSSYGCVIVDEAHERSLDTDILLSYLKSVCAARADFRVIIASATVDPTMFLRFFGVPPAKHEEATVRIPGRTFPIDHEWNARPADFTKRPVFYAVQKALDIHASGTPGDILVFLPTPDDVTDAVKQKARFGDQAIVLPLHGRLSAEEQQEVFLPTPSHVRKIVFSTNVAETSVTIDGIVHVVDTGLEKSTVYDAARNCSSLVVRPITKSSSIQRAGRAGRTRAGIAHHLYSQADFESMEQVQRPEILRVELGGAVLRLAELGVRNPLSFDFMEHPGREPLQAAVSTLKAMGFIGPDGACTPDGRKAVVLGVEPRLARMILTSSTLGVRKSCLYACGMMNAQGMIFKRSDNKNDQEEIAKKRSEWSDRWGDVVMGARILSAWMAVPTSHRKQWAASQFLIVKTLQSAEEWARQTDRTMRSNVALFQEELARADDSDLATSDVYERIARSFFTGHFDQLCIANGPPRAGLLLGKEIPGAVQLAREQQWGGEDDGATDDEGADQGDDGAGDFDGDACAICMIPLQSSASVSLVPCGHVFHQSCVFAWMERSQTCPFCRTRVLSAAGAASASAASAASTAPAPATSTVFIHPSSSMFNVSGGVQWVAFQTLMITKRPFIRNVCVMDPSWKEIQSSGVRLDVMRACAKSCCMTYMIRPCDVEFLPVFLGPRCSALRTFEQAVDALIMEPTRSSGLSMEVYGRDGDDVARVMSMIERRFDMIRAEKMARQAAIEYARQQLEDRRQEEFERRREERDRERWRREQEAEERALAFQGRIAMIEQERLRRKEEAAARQALFEQRCAEFKKEKERRRMEFEMRQKAREEQEEERRARQAEYRRRRQEEAAEKEAMRRERQRAFEEREAARRERQRQAEERAAERARRARTRPYCGTPPRLRAR